MSSYYAKAGAPGMGGAQRIVAVTGALSGGLLRVVDVNVRGVSTGSPTYLPANFIISEMILDTEGYLVDKISDVNEEIDWKAHEDKPGDIAEDEATQQVESSNNPAMAAFPELSGE